MAGAGFKTFNTGDVLTAADVNTYLMQQTVMVFASSAARSTALGVNVAEGMLSYLKDTDVVEVYNGSAWVSSDDPNAIQNSIVDAKGDLISATADNTPARLASSGVNGNVLTVDTSTSTGLKWAAPSGGLTLIKQASFSAVADTGTTFDAMFSSSYFDYLIAIDHIFSSVNDTEIYFQGRIATPSTITSGYYGITTRRNFVTTEVNFASDNAAQFSLGKVTNAKGGALSGFYHVSMVGNSSEAMKIHGLATDGASIGWDIFGGKIQNDQTYTGFLLKASSGNVTGRVSVYGLAK